MPSTTKQIRWLQSFFKIQKYFKSMRTKSYISLLQNQCDGIKSVGEDLIYQSVIKYSRAKQFIKTSKSTQANRNCPCCFNIFWGFFHKSTMGNWKWTYSIKIVYPNELSKHADMKVQFYGIHKNQPYLTPLPDGRKVPIWMKCQHKKRNQTTAKGIKECLFLFKREEHISVYLKPRNTRCKLPLKWQ